MDVWFFAVFNLDPMNSGSSSSLEVIDSVDQAKRPRGRLIRSFIARISFGPAEDGLQLVREPSSTHIQTTDGAFELVFTAAKEVSLRNSREGDMQWLILGDDAEWKVSEGRSCMAHAACIKWDLAGRSFSVLSSMTALPPVFMYRAPTFLLVASELRLIRDAVRERLSINAQSAVELFRFGYPLDYRTLFNEVEMMPASHLLDVRVGEQLQLRRLWDAPDHSATTESSNVDQACAAFEEAIGSLSLSESVFALTGGLDTRAILAKLPELGAKPIACTITGERRTCLDARQAAALSRAYGLQHVLITLGDEFVRELPKHTLEASLLSGGLASIEQAHEIYFYRQVSGLGSRRLAGTLGNQVARRGVEGVSCRNADSVVLNPELRTTASVDDKQHWLEVTSRHSRQPILQLLLEREVPFSSVANFSVGHKFMIQQSPYANRRLIEAMLAANLPSMSRFMPMRARLRDLRHRFLGHSHKGSFQVRAVRDSGGAAAHYPINWGWRADGGISPTGIGWGLLALTDAAGSMPFVRWKFVRKASAAVGVTGLSEIKQPREWLDQGLRELLHDTLHSKFIAESGLFCVSTMRRVLQQHTKGTRFHHATLSATLDLALAYQTFSLAPRAVHCGTDGAPPDWRQNSAHSRWS